MTSINALLARVNSKRDRVSQASAALAKRKDELSAAERQLKEALEAGMSSGNHVKDLVLRQRGGLDLSMFYRLVPIDEKLMNRAGELVLMMYVQQMVTFSQRGGPGDSSDLTNSFDFFACGVLSSDMLRWGKRGIELPVDQFVYTWTQFPSNKLKFVRRFPQNAHYPKSLPAIAEASCATGWEPGTSFGNTVHIIVGDADVRAVFEHLKAADAFAQCCEMLNKLVLTAE